MNATPARRVTLPDRPPNPGLGGLFHLLCKREQDKKEIIWIGELPHLPGVSQLHVIEQALTLVFWMLSLRQIDWEV